MRFIALLSALAIAPTLLSFLSDSDPQGEPAKPVSLMVSTNEASGGPNDEPDEKIDFNRDIRPILSDRCFLCHGPDRSSEQSKKSSLRLDDRDLADDGGAFDFDDPEESELIYRVISDDPGEVMPPLNSHKKRLTEAEVDLLTRWIEQGAPYADHWAYITPERPDAPEGADAANTYNEIDNFVLARLAERNMSPSAPANRAALIRRATFDLWGLPPTVEQVDAFVNDPANDDEAFEKVLDRLLANPKYGEHMATAWLDACRYADTHGYQYDQIREQWVWRDWVINAFNTNLPWDQFTVQQIAGDMLPDATDQTRLATGCQRNHPITVEGGVIDEEYRTEYVMDRVTVASTVWMGQTFACARCHDHKYDPISQDDFFSFYALFNNVPEKGLMGFAPKQKIKSPLHKPLAHLEQKRNEIADQILGLDLLDSKTEAELKAQSDDWRQIDGQFTAEVIEPDPNAPNAELVFNKRDDGSMMATGGNPAKVDYIVTVDSLPADARSIRIEAIPEESLPNKSVGRAGNGNFVLTELAVESAPAGSNDFTVQEIVRATADYQQKGYPVAHAIDGNDDGQAGWAVDGNSRVEKSAADFSLCSTILAGEQLKLRLNFRWGMSHAIGRMRISVLSQEPIPAPIRAILNVENEKRSRHQRVDFALFLIDRNGTTEQRDLAKQYRAINAAIERKGSFPETMVMAEMEKPRQTFVLDRGEYDKQLKDREVFPAVPSAMGSLKEYPQNRLGFAQWLVSPEQPLMGRVTVNRFWQDLFGVGIVKTSEDFGSQGEFPTHPKLLDWLAVEFRESGWDTKGLLKMIMMSRTYRQTSVAPKAAYAHDPENRWLSRGPRLRLQGEAIRDNALAVSGLLHPEIGGPSVYPYHPQGLWLEMNNRPGYSRAYPHTNDLDQLYRRSLYTYWKRTVPPPSVATFDGPSREYCVVRRSRTNTPLQALVLLHDPQFVEAARVLGARMVKEGGDDLASQIRLGFRLCFARQPSETELEIYQAAYVHWHKHFEDPADIENLLSVGVTPVDPQLDRRDLAAMTQIARIFMNQDEFIVK